jgi:hypothetical protein
MFNPTGQLSIVKIPRPGAVVAVVRQRHTVSTTEVMVSQFVRDVRLAEAVLVEAVTHRAKATDMWASEAATTTRNSSATGRRQSEHQRRPFETRARNALETPNQFSNRCWLSQGSLGK